MRRREFIGLLASAAVAQPIAALGQQPMHQTIGFFRSTPSRPFAHLLEAFRQGLKESGFVDGRNVAIEQRYADNHNDRLPGLAADLVNRQVSAIVGNIAAVEAARAATRGIPIIFVVAEDPLKVGLVTNLARPEGNLTGVTFFGGAQLDVKRVELLHELIPEGVTIAALLDSSYRGSQLDLPKLRAAGRSLGHQIVVISVSSDREFEAAFARVATLGAGAVLVSGSPLFTSRRREIVALAARHAVPAIYDLRDFVIAGGLISYSASITGAYRQAGVYAGKILKGAKPSDLPVVQPTRFELVINLRTAKALGMNFLPSILARAEEVIE